MNKKFFLYTTGCNYLLTISRLYHRLELHIRNALKSCSYPKWIFDKVKHDQCQKRKKTTIDIKKRNKSVQESKGLAVIPYVEGLSETAERILRKYEINTAMKPYRTLRQLLVHPKDPNAQ